MPAFLITEIEVHDPEGHEAYRAAGPKTFDGYDATLLVRGGEIAVLEGEWEPKRLVIAQFPDLSTIRRWYASPEYQAAKKLRETTASLNMVAVEGT